jgi:hypothetical protein
MQEEAGAQENSAVLAIVDHVRTPQEPKTSVQRVRRAVALMKGVIM